MVMVLYIFYEGNHFVFVMLLFNMMIKAIHVKTIGILIKKPQTMTEKKRKKELTQEMEKRIEFN